MTTLGGALRNNPLAFVCRAAGDPRPDAELLARLRDDPAAFADLVDRHGPMVWGVCRHLLGEADAEDAFQATFLAFHRSCWRVRDGAALAGWLHGVAVRVSLAARREAGRRTGRERSAARPEATPPWDDWADTMAAVHQEVAALPEADRTAFVLCVIEGLTQAEAAVRLGRTAGAVAGQVARAKARLVARLTRRGIAPGLAALGWTPAVAEKASNLLGLVPQQVLQLAKGATEMSWPKMIAALSILGVALAAGILAAGGGPLAPPEDNRPPAKERAEAAPRVPEGAKPGGARDPDPVRKPPRPDEAKPDSPKRPNLSLWVPDEELRVWDPVNPNVNPVPWRVFGAKTEDGQRSDQFRHLAVGKKVRVEGIGWGYDVATEQPKSQVVFEGGTVLVRGVDLNKADVRGRCVRVVGTLRLDSMRWPGFYRQLPLYYYIDAESVEVIDQVAEPRVLLD